MSEGEYQSDYEEYEDEEERQRRYEREAEEYYGETYGGE